MSTPTKEPRTVTAHIYRSEYDASNGGISANHKTVQIMSHADTMHYLRDEIPDNAVTLVKRIMGNRAIFHFEPVKHPDGVVGPMAGGTYVGITGILWRGLIPAEWVHELPYGALSLHDRFETPSQYAALSR